MNYGEWKSDYEERGRCAYDAYCRASGGKSLVTGAELPEFRELSEQIRAAWVSVANAVCQRFGAIS